MRFEELAAAVTGDWTGTKSLYLSPPPEPPASSRCTLAASLVAGGSFVQFNYTWSYDGADQTGVLLFGYDEENAASAAWVDSFHMSSRIMYCTGTAADGAVSVRGSYAAPPGPDWGWSMTIKAAPTTELQLVMHNISPEGEEYLAVEAKFTRCS